MDEWFNRIAARCELSAGALQDLRDVGMRPETIARFSPLAKYLLAVKNDMHRAGGHSARGSTNAVRRRDDVHR